MKFLYPLILNQYFIFFVNPNHNILFPWRVLVSIASVCIAVANFNKFSQSIATKFMIWLHKLSAHLPTSLSYHWVIWRGIRRSFYGNVFGAVLGLFYTRSKFSPVFWVTSLCRLKRSAMVTFYCQFTIFFLA